MTYHKHCEFCLIKFICKPGLFSVYCDDCKRLNKYVMLNTSKLLIEWIEKHLGTTF